MSISDVGLVDPVEDEMVGLGSLELGSHMASTVDSRESEATVVGFKVSSNLGVDNV